MILLATFKRIVHRLVQHYLRIKFGRVCTLTGKVTFGRHTRITPMYGSKKTDIKIADKSKIFGSIISQNGGQVVIEENVQIGPQTLIGSSEYIEIRKGALLANNIKVVDNNNHPVNPEDRIVMNNSPVGSRLRSWCFAKSSKIIIEENVWIGQDARINKGVTIGENSIVAAGTVVTKNVPKNAIVAGNPGVIVKRDIDKEPSLL